MKLHDPQTEMARPNLDSEHRLRLIMVDVDPSTSSTPAARKGHFSSLYFIDQEHRQEIPSKDTVLVSSNYEGKRYDVPKDLPDNLFDEIEAERIENEKNGKTDIRWIREKQRNEEGSDYRYRYWLQIQVEQMANGTRSIKILKSLESELEEAENLWNKLSDELEAELKDLSNYLDSLPIRRGKAPPQFKKIGSYYSSNNGGDFFKDISKLAIKTLFQTIRKTPQTLEGFCQNLNKNELWAYLEPIIADDEAFYGHLRREDSNANLREILIDTEQQNKLLKENFVKYKKERGEYTFSQTPSYFLLKLYPRVRTILSKITNNKITTSQKICRCDKPCPPDCEVKLAIKISRYIHYLLCQMDWIRLNMANLGETENLVSAEEDWEQKSLPTVHRFSKKLIGKINQGDHAMVRQFHPDLKRSMYCAPKKHTTMKISTDFMNLDIDFSNFFGGGLHTFPASKANDGNFRKFYSRGDIESEQIELSGRTLSALDHLQETQWSINLDFLHTVAEFTLEGRPLENKLHDIRHAAWAQTDGLKFQEWVIEGLGLKKPSVFLKPRLDTWNRVLIQTRKNMLNAGNVFWHAWWCDWRGRFSTRTPDIGPQGDDFSKALLLFTEWKPLGEKGKRWLYVKMYDYFCDRISTESKITSRASFADKEAWVTEHKEQLCEIGAQPKQYMKELGFEKEPPKPKSENFQRLATVIEFYRVHKEFDRLGNWDEIKSGLPIHLDASCNGFQHMAALLRDKELAKKVNILDNDGEIGDLYQDVADKAQELLIPGGKELSELGKFLVEKAKIEQKDLEQWRRLFTRKICKKPVMITAYGATDVSKALANRHGGGGSKYIDVKKLKIVQPLDRIKKLKHFKKLTTDEQNQIEEDHKNEKYNTERMYQLDEAGGLYQQRKRTIHHDSTLYAVLDDLKKDNIPGIDNLFFTPDSKSKGNLKNSILCFELAHKMSRHLIIAIEQVTNNAHKEIDKTLKKLSKEALEIGEYFSWTTGPKSSRVRIIEFKPKRSHFANLSIQSPADSLKDQDKLFASIGKYLLQNAEILQVDNAGDKRSESYVERAQGRLEVLQESDVASQSRSKRKARQWISKEIHRLFEICLKKDSDFPEKREIQDLLVGLYNLHKIDVPFKAEPTAKNPVNEGASLYKDIKKELSKNPKKPEKFETIAIEKKYESEFYDNEDFKGDKPWKLPHHPKQITPNFIHSFDAKHMENVILNLKESGIKDFWAVHDSFGTHASNIDKLIQIVNKEFRNLHKDDFNKIESRISAEIGKEKIGKARRESAEDKAKDKFEIDDVKNSKYLIY